MLHRLQMLLGMFLPQSDSDGSVEINIMMIDVAGIGEDYIEWADLYYEGDKIWHAHHETEHSNQIEREGRIVYFIERNGNELTYTRYNNGTQRWLTITWNNPPENISSAELELRAKWSENNEDYENSKTAPVFLMDAPSITSVSEDQCDRIQLNWTNPSPGSCGDAVWKTLIYRNGAYLTEITDHATTWTDTDASLIYGESHNYAMHTGYECINVWRWRNL